jgi:type IV pilus assembly protein PilX
MRARRERGFILVTGLLFLVVMTLLGLALFRSSGLLDRLTANTRDKQRSFEAAQSSIEYTWWWLQTPGGGGTGTTCNGNTAATTVSTLHVCSEALSTSLTTIASLGWADKAFRYPQQGMTVLAGGGMNAAGTDVNYSQPPGVYLENLGLDTSGKNTYYQSTAYGYGGDGNAVSVVRATFKRTAKSKNRGKA